MDHPAKFPDRIVTAIGLILTEETEGPLKILDPFAGVGRIHELTHVAPNGKWRTAGVEIEPEWADEHPRTEVGDALRLRFRAGSFDVVATSPCMDQAHRVLTRDLRWVPCGDLKVGDGIVAYEEEPSFVKTNGQPARRRWTFAEVVRSEPKRVPTLRVTLANDDVMYVTPEHPWLANKYMHKTEAAEWVRTDRLAPGMAVYRQFDGTWGQAMSRDAGWLAGMFDGEGSLSLGVHGAPKMTLCQVVGPVGDAVEEQMRLFGLKPNVIPRTGVPENRQPINNYYVTGGMSGIMRALGVLRPMRLLQKWSDLDIGTRAIQPEKIEVVAVEPAFTRDIQEIETTSGTYFGEGYLMHNCYGNRMADHHNARDFCKVCDGSGEHPEIFSEPDDPIDCEACGGWGLSKRNTYRAYLGRQLSEGSSAAMQWGPAYREFHAAAWAEAVRVLKPGGLLIVNISNHFRKGNEQRVSEFHINTLCLLGCSILRVDPIFTQRNRQGANGDLRADRELIVVARTPDPRRPN